MSPYSKEMADYAEEKSLKESIISQARAVYGAQYPTGHTFDVVITECYDQDDDGNRKDEGAFVARLLVYTRASSFAKFEIIMRTQATYEQIEALRVLEWKTKEKASALLSYVNEDDVEVVGSEDEV